MPNQLSSAEVQKLMASIPKETLPIFNQVLSVVAMQAAMIDDLVWKLDIEDSADALKKQVMIPAMNQLAAKLNTPVAQGVSLEEVTSEIAKMNTALQSAATAKNVFETVLGFALKISPLA